MRRPPLVLSALALSAVALAAQQETQGTAAMQFEGALVSTPGLASRMTGGVGLAFGGRLGAKESPFTLWVEVLHHAFRQYQTEDYAAYVHTDVTLQAEYALTDGGLYHTQVLALLALGGEFRNPYRAAPEMLGGIGFRYELTELVAFRGAIEDRITFIPREQFTCAAGQACYPGYVISRDTRHTPSALVSLELSL